MSAPAVPAQPPDPILVAPHASSSGDLTRRTVGGLAWSATARVGTQVVQFLITAVLARLLVPAEFGLVEMYAVFTGFAIVFVDLGLAAAIVQRKDLEERHLSSAFWLNLGGGLTATVLLMALSPAIAAFYGQSKIIPLMLVSSVNFLLGAPSIVQSALLKRGLKFRRLAAVDVTATLLSGAVGIAAAFWGAGVWSLVYLTLTSTATRSVVLWFSTDWRPKRLVDRDAVRELWRFSGHLLGFMSIGYWTANADNLLIGRFIGVGSLGIYARAYNTMLLPLSQISGVTSAVMFPALAGIQDDKERVKNGYLRGAQLIALIAFPTLIGLIVVAPQFIVVAYGHRWASAVPLLRALCVAGLAQCVSMTGAWIYQSQGRTDWMFRWGVIQAAATMAGFAVGIHWGAQGVAISYAVVTVAAAYPGLAIPGRLIGMSFQDVALTVYKPLVAALAMGAIIFAAGKEIPQGWPASCASGRARRTRCRLVRPRGAAAPDRRLSRVARTEKGKHRMTRTSATSLELI